MSISTSGTTPGLAPKAEEKLPIVSMRCKGINCDSREFNEIKVASPEHIGLRIYRCIKCGNIQSVSVGGAFNL
jgi:hypothetical protein